MKQQLYVVTSAFGLIATPAWAEPCVSETFDVPLPGATSMASFVADVPSVQFPAFWQEGTIGDYRYQIFSNGEGVLYDGQQDDSWTIELACSAENKSCDVSSTEDSPQAAVLVAQSIGQCLKGVEPETEDVTKSVSATDQTTSADAETAPEPLAVRQEPTLTTLDRPCGLARTNEASDIAILQRLLILLGSNPGPVDGFLGPLSFAALESYVENPGWSTSIADTITLLDDLHCRRS